MWLFDFFKKKNKVMDKGPKKLMDEKNEAAPLSSSQEIHQENRKEETQKPVPVKKMTFEVRGTFIAERQKAIRNLIKELKQNYFYLEPYEGLKNKELKEMYFEEKVYEYDGATLPNGYLEEEDDNEYDPNAVKVILTNSQGERVHVGYVPKELCLEVRDMKSRYDVRVLPTIEKGKYKIATYDDMGEEKVQTLTEDYEISVCLTFWEKVAE